MMTMMMTIGGGVVGSCGSSIFVWVDGTALQTEVVTQTPAVQKKVGWEEDYDGVAAAHIRTVVQIWVGISANGTPNDGRVTVSY